MKKNDVPKIEPINVKRYEFKQSPIPTSRPTTIQEASWYRHHRAEKVYKFRTPYLKIYRGCFETNIHCQFHSAHIDEAYKEVLKYIEKELNNRQQKRTIFNYLFDEYDPESLARIIDTQHKVIEYQKKNKMNKLYSCLLVADVFAEG